jgi:hypothetical protein
MHFLNMLAIYKSQMLNFKIQIRYPLYLDVFMCFNSSNDLKTQKLFTMELKGTNMQKQVNKNSSTLQYFNINVRK